MQCVEYSLSQKGASLLPLLEHLQDWGLANIKNVLSIQEMVTITVS
jgi:DNA-binding HxlR family transcriptional regulator